MAKNLPWKNKNLKEEEGGPNYSERNTSIQRFILHATEIEVSKICHPQKDVNSAARNILLMQWR